MSAGKNKQSIVRDVVARAIEQIRDGKIVDLDAEFLGDPDSPEAWLVEAVADLLVGHEARAKRHIREAIRRGAGVQLEIPGMEHAALPMTVFRGEQIVPAWAATLDEMEAQTARDRRSIDAQSAIIAGYEGTFRALRVLGVPGSATGAEIAEKFPPAIGDGS